MVDRLFTDEQIEYAVENAPQDTRARFRGLLVSKPDLQGKSVRWDRVTYHSKKRKMMQKCVECPIKDCAQYEYEHRVEEIKLDDPLNNYQELEASLG